MSRRWRHLKGFKEWERRGWSAWQREEEEEEEVGGMEEEGGLKLTRATVIACFVTEKRVM